MNYIAELTEQELLFHIDIEKKRLDVHMKDLKSLSRKIVHIKHDLLLFEKELLKRNGRIEDKEFKDSI